MSVGATIVVEFGARADSSAFVAVELDETLNVNDDGSERSQLAPGDEVWWWVQHDATLRIDRVACTSGMAVDCGLVRRQRVQEVTWTGENVVELSHIPAANPEYQWYGNIGEGLSRDGRQVTVTGNTPCTGDATIPIDVHLYRYVPPPITLEGGSSYRVVIVLYMEAA